MNLVLGTIRDELPYIRTYTGIKYRHADPWPEDICIEDIAHALSLCCRFTGHTREFYSVAQHCVLASLFVSEKNQLWALLHDASEAYCGDLNRPLKYSSGLEGYKHYEKLSQKVICCRFGLEPDEPKEVKDMDWTLLATEGRDLFNCPEEVWGTAKPLDYTITPWSPDLAEKIYLKRFYDITESITER